MRALALTLAMAAFAAGQSPYEFPSGKRRAAWAVNGTVGPASLMGGTISAAFGTAFDVPSEYGPHWEGYGKRYAMRLTGIATSNAMEAGLGALWGEDPRYLRVAGRPFKSRVGNVVKMTFFAQDRGGRARPAYARFAAITGSNYLSNTWRADSEATARRATIRVPLGFLGRMAGNAWQEFWPDVRQRIGGK